MCTVQQLLLVPELSGVGPAGGCWKQQLFWRPGWGPTNKQASWPEMQRSQGGRGKAHGAHGRNPRFGDWWVMHGAWMATNGGCRVPNCG